MKRIVKKWGNTHENKEQEEKCGPLFDTGFACRCTSYLDCKRSFSQGMTNFKEPLLVLNASEIFDRVKNGDRPSAASFAVEDMVFNISGRCKEEARKAGENATVCEPSQEHAGKICAQFLREKLQTGNSDSRREIVYRFLNDFDMFVKKFDATSKKRRKVSEESKRVGKKRKNIVKNLKRECRK
nr:hypothetical protein BaRGS_029194 [Batillaria attramentaria]